MSNPNAAEKPKTRETYTISVIRNTIEDIGGGTEKMSGQQILDVTADAVIASQLLRSTADVVAQGGKSKTAAALKGFLDGVEAQRKQALKDGKPDPVQEFVKSIGDLLKGDGTTRPGRRPGQ